MDEDANISQRTLNREIAAVNKMGYLDGASDGQKSVFQSSFDLGYQQGLSFGFELGIKKALSMHQQPSYIESHLNDPRKLNCQICLDVLTLQLSVVKLHKKQCGTNIELLNIDNAVAE